MVVDRASGARRPLSTSISHEGVSGVISPDGTTAAIVQPATDGRSADVRLIDLTSGADRDTGITITDDQGTGPQSLVWSPDSKWVFSAANGHLVAIAGDAAQATDLGLTLPALTQVAIRAQPDRDR